MLAIFNNDDTLSHLLGDEVAWDMKWPGSWGLHVELLIKRIGSIYVPRSLGKTLHYYSASLHREVLYLFAYKPNDFA